jgi:fatty acid desaturase
MAPQIPVSKREGRVAKAGATWPHRLPIQDFRRHRHFYVRYDLAYAVVGLACLAASAHAGFRPLFGRPSVLWLGAFPLLVYALIFAHLCVHNASHAAFPRWLNRPLGEILGTLVIVRFASWSIVHARHHAFSDDPESDPHPALPSFWRTTKHTIVNVERQLQRFYLETWGDTRESRAYEATRAKVSYLTNLLLLAVWLRWLGAPAFGLLFLPANVLAGLFVIHFNWTTHNGLRGRDFAPVNLNHGYFWLGNRLFLGIYMHANHHRRPSVLNPARCPVENVEPAEGYRALSPGGALEGD